MRPSNPFPRLNEAEVASAISAYFHVATDDKAVGKLLAAIFPDVERAAAADPGSWKSVFPGVLAKYESLAKELGLGLSPLQRELAAAQTRNPTAAGPAIGEFGQFASRSLSNLPLALREERSGRSTSERSLDTREASLSVNGAIAYAREIGISPAFAGFFVGGSQDMRDALRSAIRDGTAITDDKVKSMQDVGMVIGAIRAGKLGPNDPRIPQSVRDVIEDMKNKGIDPTKADSRTIRKYLDTNPKALDAAKKRNVTDDRPQQGKTEHRKHAEIAAGPTEKKKGVKLDSAASL
jgi:hypothetical protein